jgi:hypothetical protein
MSFNWFKFSILIVTVAVMSSCLWDDEEKELSSNPYFYSLKFAKNDSIPNIQTAVFTLDYDSIINDSIIVNLDSLPYQTRIDSVFPTFTFMSTAGSYLILSDSPGTGTDTIALTGKDTVDFTRVIAVRNIAENQKAERTYKVKVNVHQVQPELFHWNRLNASVYTHAGAVQRVLLFDNRFLFYASSGLNNYLYTSTNGSEWAPLALQGFPSDVVDLRSLTEFNNSLYYLHENSDLYRSTNGSTWTKVAVDAGGTTIVNLLFALEGKLWATVKHSSTGQHYFATSANGAGWTIGATLPANFPVGDYAALSFASRTKKPKAIVLGGYASNGTLLRNAWSVERNVYNEYKWVDFSIENTSLVSLAGASLVNYDDKLLLFGGMNANDEVNDPFYIESIDEGLSWRAVDTTYNVIYDEEYDASYAPRSYQSVVYEPVSKSLFLFGGRTSQVYTDVWRGKLNRLSFKRQ